MVARPNRRLLLGLRGIALLLLASVLGACATGGGDLVPVAPVGAQPLAPGNGYLLVHIETDLPLASVTTSGGRVATTVPKGASGWLVELPAGRYSWRSVEPAASTGTKRAVDLRDYRRLQRFEDWVWDDEYDFDVVAGEVNYPGTLVVVDAPPWLSPELCCVVRIRNRSAIALRAVLDDYGPLIDRMPLRHGGAGRDGFLAYYARERDRLRQTGAEEGVR